MVAGMVIIFCRALPAVKAAQEDPVKEKTAQAAGDYPIKPVPFTAVHLSDVFWAPRIEINRTVTIPFAFEQCEKSGRMDNFVRAAAALRGEELKNKALPPYPFDDTDPYKVLEGASYALAVKPDPKMKAYLDDLIAKIGAAQEPDGYLYTARTINPQHPHDWSGPKRWERDPDQSHELYNAGHLFEAAAAHFQATGERNLLDIAVKEANLLCNTFGPNKLHIWPGHEIVEMGLVKLYRATGERRYLDLAKFFLDVRGPGGDEYHQSHIKPVDQTKAVGHAVRAGYLYSGMADVAAMTDDQRYLHAIDAIWENVVGKKLYLTGGIGAMGAGEAFGDDYQLPNLSAYCETCAAVANDYWNLRLFLLHGDAKYIDVMERTLYNGLISGVSLDGKLFFYPNPLESDGQHQRSPWFGVACCPGNITRFLASVPGYVYAQRDGALYVNLYAGGVADVKMDDGRTIKITQETRYPWDGAVKIKVEPDKPGEFTVNVRIPGWARDEAVPSDLYKFMDKAKEPVTIKVNGGNVPSALDKGYVGLKRSWKSGDVIELNLPMPVRRILANNKVADDVGKVALQRGPLVYCIEWPDVKDGKVLNLLLPDKAAISAEFRADLLGGVEILRGEALSLRWTEGHKIEKEKVEFTAIPYYAWANRGPGQMAVWLARLESAGHPLPFPTIASASKATASDPGADVKALNDQREPKSSDDHSNRYLHWWPRKGTKEWVQYDFAKPARVSAVEVYWFDDTGTGECRLPKSWELFYREKGQWKPVANPSEFGCDADCYNRAIFDAVESDGLRLEVQLPEGFSSGIHEWRVIEAKANEAEPAQTGAEDKIIAIDPPEKDFFSKVLYYDGIPIKAPKEVADEALFAAKARLSMMMGNLPEVRTRLKRAGAELHIIGRNQVTTDLPEWRRDKGKPLAEYNGLTRDQRTRGMGGRLTSCGEENLLKLDKDRYKGRDICVHEFAHNIFQYGASSDVRAKFQEQYKRSLDKGLWNNSYAGSNIDEYFAELTMWYFGTHGDLHMTGPKPENGPEGLKKYDPDAFALFDEFYSGRMTHPKAGGSKANSAG